jgi:hypothetical protein
VSCGAGTAVAVLAIAACVMSTAGMVEGETHVLEKCGVSSDAAGGIGLGCSIAGAVMSLGAGAAASGAEVGAEAATTTASASGAAGKTATTAASVATTTAKVASVSAAGADVAGGAATIESSHYAAEAEDRTADAQAAQSHAALVQQVITDLLANLSDDTKANERRLGEVQGAMHTQDAALAAAVMTRST